MKNSYDSDFYAIQSGGSRRSASVVVPIVVDLFQPRSVIDFGCGVGTWLAEFAATGIDDLQGLDGDYVPRDQLQISADRFRAVDLTHPPTLDRRYDLAMSVEVAEHLPAECAAEFVSALTAAAPAVLFSAAIPHQGGIHHVNEQWPEYWRELFRRQGYSAVDAIRPRVWGHGNVDWWYQQNVLLYCHSDALAANPRLQPVNDERMLDLVHPYFFTFVAERDPTLGEVLSILPRMIVNSIAFRLGFRR